MRDSPEFSANAAPLGIPGNPLDAVQLWMGGLGDTRRPRKWWAPGTKEPLEGHEVPRLENPGMTNVGSAGLHWDNVPQVPEDLRVPDPVSATDPAFAMRPEALNIREGLKRVPASTYTEDSPFTQLKVGGNPKYMRKSEILSALGIPGLDLPYTSQGELNT